MLHVSFLYGKTQEEGEKGRGVGVGQGLVVTPVRCNHRDSF